MIPESVASDYIMYGLQNGLFRFLTHLVVVEIWHLGLPAPDFCG